jgi:hypothetical protein
MKEVTGSEKVIEETLNKNKGTLVTLKTKAKEEKDKPPKEKKKGFLENPKAMRNARSISVGLIIFLLPLIYFLTKDSFDFMALISMEMGLLVLYTGIGSFMNIWETRKRAFEDTVDENQDISDNEILITENGQELSKHTLKAMPKLNEYNDLLQESYDLQKTQKKIRKIKVKIAMLSISKNNAQNKYFSRFAIILLFPKLLNKMHRNIKGRKIKRRENKIMRLKAVNLRDKRFTPYRIERLLTARSSNRYTYIGDKQIRSAPDKVDAKKTIAKLPLKSLGYSLGGGVIPLAMGEKIGTVLIFYLGYLTGQVITSLTQYLVTKYKTTHEFRVAQKEKIRLQEMLLKSVADDEEAEKQKEIEEQKKVDEAKRLEEEKQRLEEEKAKEPKVEETEIEEEKEKSE